MACGSEAGGDENNKPIDQWKAPGATTARFRAKSAITEVVDGDASALRP